ASAACARSRPLRACCSRSRSLLSLVLERRAPGRSVGWCHTSPREPVLRGLAAGQLGHQGLLLGGQPLRNLQVGGLLGSRSLRLLLSRSRLGSLTIGRRSSRTGVG